MAKAPKDDPIIQAAISAERLANARLLIPLRVVIAAVWFALVAISWIVLGKDFYRPITYVVGAYVVLAVAYAIAARLSPTVLRITWYSAGLLDLPILFVFGI